MKISNYMNNTNSIMEKNTDKVQKGNSQTNEKHTVGQSVKLSISNEGLEYYRNRIQQSGQEKYDDVVQRKELLASKKISDIDYSYEIQKKPVVGMYFSLCCRGLCARRSGIDAC